MPHTHFMHWEQDGNDAVHTYCNHELRIVYNSRTGFCDGYIAGRNADMHCQRTHVGLGSLARMLQQAVDKRIDAEQFKYTVGQRVTAKCGDGKLRGNGIVESRRFIPDGKNPDAEPNYLVAFAGAHYSVPESAIFVSK